MKNFIICAETAFIAFLFGIAYANLEAKKEAQQNEEASEEETPA